MIHQTRHELADQKVTAKTAQPLWSQADSEVTLRIEDWWDRAAGISWMNANGNPAAMNYAMRAGLSGLPLDNEVVYGHTPDGLGHLVHMSEIVPATAPEAVDQDVSRVTP